MKGRLGKHKQLTLDCTIKCTKCDFVHQTTIIEQKEIAVPIIISDQAESIRRSISLHPDEELRLDQELILEEHNVVIKSLEVDGKRVSNATVKDVTTIWSKTVDPYGKVQLKISVHKGPNTLSYKLDALPDEEFFIGDILRLGRNNIAIYKIKTHSRVIKYDSAIARDIVRIYGRAIR